uniref:Uncharacterized protein LOC111109456 isoform X1 n=1 Tax=Crassostrea virginica TaxID=6565 RepID=A0A8B8BDJ7_CRAVI|nr:uncharacterized protein LOC111109456 isoform X1 [Crassostrea virginica]
MFKLRKIPCAVMKLDWEIDKRNFSCTSSINVYHCIQDERNRSGEICIQPVWVQPNYCPEFNTGARALDTVPCNVTKGCPNVTFLSNEAYQYPVCLNKTHKKEILENGVYSLPWFWIVIPVVLGIALLVLSAAYFVWRRKRDDQKKNETSNSLGNSEPFHRTKAFHEAIQYLENGGTFLVLSGIWGSGKTKTAKEVYRSVTGKSPTIITDLQKFDCEEQNQALIFDEAISGNLSFGEMKNLQDNIKLWLAKVSNGKKPRLAKVSNGKKPWLAKMSIGKSTGLEKISIEHSLLENKSTCETKPFIIFTSVGDQKSIFDYITSAASDKNLKVINLNNSLTKGDRTQILYSHFTISCPNKDFSKIEDLATMGKNESLGYPEMCVMFCRCDDFQKNKGVDFCKSPLRSLRDHLEEMYHSEKNKFFMLVYMSLNQMEMDVENPDEMLFHELETCKIHNQTQAEPSVDTKIEIVQHGEMDSGNINSLISCEFVDKVPKSSKYRLQHYVIKRMTLIVFGTFHFGKLLELSKPEDLKGFIKEEGIVTKVENAVGDIMPYLIIGGEKWLQYQQKIGWKTAGKS